MPVHFTLDKTQRLVWSLGSGVITDSDLLDHMGAIAKLFERSELDSTWAQLSDFSGVTSVDGISAECIQRLADGNPWPEESVRVFIVPREVLLGLARMYQILGDRKTQRLHIVQDKVEGMQIINRERSGHGDAI